jgi:hypothetical protein
MRLAEPPRVVRNIFGSKRKKSEMNVVKMELKEKKEEVADGAEGEGRCVVAGDVELFMLIVPHVIPCELLTVMIAGERMNAT